MPRIKRIKLQEKDSEQTSITISGAQSSNGTRYVRAEQGGRVAFVEYALFVGDGHAGLQSLGDQGIVVVGRNQCTIVMNAIAALDPPSDFPKTDLLERAGWCDCHYVMPNGRIISPQEKECSAATTFPANVRRQTTKGTCSQWTRLVAGRLVGMPLPMFALSVAFIGPLLRFTKRAQNPGWELCGNRGCGKTTLQGACASVWDDPHYHVTSFDATSNGLERVMARRADGVLVLDEVNLYKQGATEAAKATGRWELAFQLNNGKAKIRYTDVEEPCRYNFAFLTSANDSLADALSNLPMERVLAALDRWMTLPIPNDDLNGVFSPLPDDVEDSGEVASQLRSAVSRYHGTAGRKFVRMLVNYNAEHPGKLEWVIDRRLAEFRGE